MADDTSDYLYNAAAVFVDERQAYDRRIAQHAADDPQALAALMRLRSATYRMRIVLTGILIRRAAKEERDAALMDQATNDQVYAAAQRYVEDREDYARCLVRWGEADPQTYATSIRLKSAAARLRLAMGGAELDRGMSA